MDRLLVHGLACAAAMCALLGCAGEAREGVQQWVAAQKAAVRPQTLALPAPLLSVPPTYVAPEGPDPFSMGRLTGGPARDVMPHMPHAPDTALLAAQRHRPREALEDYPLDSMAMVGSLRQGRRAVALLHVRQAIHSVQVGDHLGQHHGRIVHIGERSIQLREVVQNAAGDWVQRIATLELQEGGP